MPKLSCYKLGQILTYNICRKKSKSTFELTMSIPFQTFKYFAKVQTFNLKNESLQKKRKKKVDCKCFVINWLLNLLVELVWINL